MNVGKFILNVVVTYVLFAVLYTVVEMYVLADQVAAMAPLMKDPAETTVSYLYYLVETIVFVWLFGKVAAGKTMMDAVVYGIMLALYSSAMSSGMLDSLKGMPDGQAMPWTIASIVIYAIIAAVLSFLDSKGWGVLATASDRVDAGDD